MIAIAALKKSQSKISDWIQDKEILLGTRSRSVKIEKGVIKLGGDKNAVATKDNQTIGMQSSEISHAESKAKEFGGSVNRQLLLTRSKPLLMLFPLVVENVISKLEKPAVTFALSLPRTDRPVVEQAYQVNKVYQRNLIEWNEADDDEEFVNDPK